MTNNKKFNYAEHYKKKLDYIENQKKLKQQGKTFIGEKGKEEIYKKEKQQPSLNTEKKLKQPTIIVIIKVLVVLIPLIIISYLLYTNFLASQEFTYYYNIGSKEDASKSYLVPLNRVSEPINTDGITYRNLTSQLVYFNVPIAKGSESIIVETKFQDNFPEKQKFMIGAKDQEDWHYSYNLIYNPTIEKLIEKYPYKSDGEYVLIKLNDDEPNYDLNDFINPQNDVPPTKLSTNEDITIPEYKIPNYQQLDMEINTALRGTQIFYVYIKDNFALNVEKRDLNWYSKEETGDDILGINLYDFNNNLISSASIADDGEDGKNPDKDEKNKQSGNLYISELDEGIYKLELKSNDDILITKIIINQGKLVLSNKAFLAQSSVYFNNFEKPSTIYFETPTNTKLTAQTYHSAAFQTIKIDNQSLKVKGVITPSNITLDSSDKLHVLISNKNDIIIKGPKYFSFTEDSYFDPFPSGKVPYKDDIEYLENNADFVLVKYNPTANINSENKWKTASTSFNLKDNSVYIKDNKLSMLFNTPHLKEDNIDSKTQQIPIDYIKVTVYKSGIIEKYNIAWLEFLN